MSRVQQQEDKSNEIYTWILPSEETRRMKPLDDSIKQIPTRHERELWPVEDLRAFLHGATGPRSKAYYEPDTNKGLNAARCAPQYR